MTYYQEVTDKDSAQNYLQSLGKDALVIYTPSALANVDIENKDIHMIDSRIFGYDLSLLDSLCRSPRRYTEVVGIGGGTATDTAKYIASQMDARLTCIPSVLSTISYATNRAELVSDNQQITVTTKLADKIILDTQLIAKASAYNLYGLADVLSIHTALFDWRLAQYDIDENLNEGIYAMSQELLKSTMGFITKTSYKKLIGSIDQIFTSIGESGHITTIYGSSRPQNGSEHIIAKRLGELTGAPHGICLAIGIMIASSLQHNPSDTVTKCLKKIGAFDNLADFGINRAVITATLEDLQPRSDRYSIVDQTSLTAHQITALINDLEKNITVSLTD